MQEGGSAPGPGRAVPTLAPTGQVYYDGEGELRVRGYQGVAISRPLDLQVVYFVEPTTLALSAPLWDS